MRGTASLTLILALALFAGACGKPGKMYEKVKPKKGGEKISHYVIHQPNTTHPDDDVIVWKGPDRKDRVCQLPPGTKVDMIETVEGDPHGYQGVLFKIKTADGRTGYVPDKWLKGIKK
ncbi:MAG: SH3 domain-containing protein [Planctomycetota bacterium]|jgi:hypothetical protein